MKKIRSILLAVDGEYDRQALIGEVATVAKDAGARVTLLSILDTPPGLQEAGLESSDLRQWFEDDSLSRMKEISSKLESLGVRVSIDQAKGKPYLEIIRKAVKGNFDLVMKPATSGSAVKKMLFGSTDMQLFRLCPRPVWAFKPTLNTELRKILIAVDLLENDQEKILLADKVLQWGKHVAGLVGSELHVIHVWDLYGEHILRGRSVTANTVDTLVLNEKQKQRRLLDAALERNKVGAKDVRIHFLKGDAKRLIPEVADATDADLLVMGTVGRTGISGFFIGNTADSVLRQVDCSVLAIKPDGFVTPVEMG